MTITEVQAHLEQGGKVAICTMTKIWTISKKTRDYLRQDSDGKGFRMGWPGKKSVYVFAYQVKLI